MPLRRLIALIINTHRTPKSKSLLPARQLAAQERNRPRKSVAATMNMIRKTILLQHPSGSQALQDLSFILQNGLLRSEQLPRLLLRPFQTKFARGYVFSPSGPKTTG